MSTDAEPRERALWRTGRKVGRTLYEQVGDEPSDHDRLIGLMDTPELAARVVANAARVADLESSIDHVLSHGTIGKQSACRLRAVLSARPTEADA